MISFTATIQQDSRDPEKKGWSFIIISKTLANKLNPGVRKGFRVKGSLDNYKIKQTSLLPVSGERFMLPINATMRKATGKKAGDKLVVQMEVDQTKPKLSADLLVCLKDEPAAEKYFKSLPPSHQRYFSTWIEGAKTEATRAKRIALALAALSRQKHFGLMLREAKERQ
jgi:uncharacterized protein YdeI (YjbR/CyaY-like superfamily)